MVIRLSGNVPPIGNTSQTLGSLSMNGYKDVGGGGGEGEEKGREILPVM